MKQMNKMCDNVREALQELCDKNRLDVSYSYNSDPLESLPSHLRKHLETCSECCAFRETLFGLPERLKAALDSAIEGQGPPNCSFTERKERFNKRPLFWAAAAILFALASVLGYLGVSTYQSHSFIREDNHLFVQRILEGSIFKAGIQSDLYAFNNDASNNGPSKSSTWFQESELSVELMGDFPFFTD